MGDVLQAARDVLAEADRGDLFGLGNHGERMVLLARGVLAMMEDASKLVDLVADERDRFRKLLVEAIDLAEEANGDESSCSYNVPIGNRLVELRALARKRP